MSFKRKRSPQKLKGRAASFKWRSVNGSRGTGSIKLLSKDRIKLKMNTMKIEDRLSPNIAKYETLKRV